MVGRSLICYDTTLEVDSYLQRIAEYVGWMQQELERHQATERTALDLLHKAQCVAYETIEAAERDAEKLRRNARVGLENAEHPDWDEYRQAMDDQGKSVILIEPTRWDPISTGGFPPSLFE
jgi:hypothetical protein